MDNPLPCRPGNTVLQTHMARMMTHCALYWGSVILEATIIVACKTKGTPIWSPIDQHPYCGAPNKAPAIFGNPHAHSVLCARIAAEHVQLESQG